MALHAPSPVLSHSYTHSAWQGAQEVADVLVLATDFLSHLNAEEQRGKLAEEAATVGGKSQAVQGVVQREMERLAFRDEAKGLFEQYPVKSLRPDYYKALPGGTGILFEVEKGKTLRNNMDLLDLWKTHLCVEAHHLWLMVPQVSMNQAGGVRERPYQAVVKRLSTFFTARTEVDVRSCVIFGY